MWVYPVEGKGVARAEWLPGMIKNDFGTCSMDSSMLDFKSDQKPEMKKLQEEIARQRRQEGAVGTILENSKVGDSSSNGRTERAIQEVGGLIGTLKLALEERTRGGKIGPDHSTIPWLRETGTRS